MKLRGEDVAQALRDWVASEIREGPRQGYDLGKFCFSVSVGTIGALGTIERLGPSPAMDASMVVSLLLLAVSMAAALFLALPRRHRLDGESDLWLEYGKRLDRTRITAAGWFALWLAGAVGGAVAVSR